MGCVPSIIRRTDECVGTDESYDEITYLKVQHYHTSPKTSKYMSNASVITSNIQRGNSKSESTLPKTNTSAEIIAGPVISSIKEKNRFKEFDLDSIMKTFKEKAIVIFRDYIILHLHLHH